jgi:hypothetical protein
MPSRMLAPFLLTLTLTACTPTPPPVPQASPTFTPGVTTYAEVVQAWGPPTNEVVQIDGRKTVTYVQMQGSPSTYVLEFGPDGVLRAMPNP